MHRLIIILTIILFTALQLKAQEHSSPAKYTNPAETENVNILSYEFFMRQDWKLLIAYSEKSLARNIDFYYLRLRLGIAYYELKQYRKALPHFEMAYAMNDSDELLKEYLYYSYVFTEQYPHALKFSKKLSPSALQKIKMDDPSPVYLLNAEGGLKFSSDTSLYKAMLYVQAGAGFRLGKSITGYGAFTQISQPMFYGTLSQQQLFASVNIPVKRSWMISPAFHFITYAFSDVAVPLPAPGYVGPPPAKPNYDGTSMVASLGVSKTWRDFLFSGSVTYSTINKARQYQQHLGICWFPLHNNRLMLSTGALLFSNDSGTSLKVVPSFGSRYFITNRLSVTAGYTSFNIKNFTEQNGYMVNNSDDITHERISAGIDWNLYRNISIYGHYIYESKTESVNEKNYHFNAGIIGIKLIF